MAVFFFISHGQKRLHFLIIWMIVFLMSWGNTSLASDATLVSEGFRKAVNEFLLTATVSSSLHEQPISTESIRTTIHENLDAGLLTKGLKAEGINFIFALPDQQNESQIAVLILSYPDEMMAASMQKKLAGMGNFFKHTIILTRFSSVAIGKHLIIMFTEKTGNKAVTKLVNEFPKFLNNWEQRKLE